LTYIVGAVHAERVMVERQWVPATVRPALFCVPYGVAGLQIKDVVVNYLKANPQQRHFLAAALVFDALVQSWPCAR
jgi:hypothetical protein